MRNNFRGMSLGVLFCFLVNTVAGDAAFSQNVLAESEYKLATTSIFSGLADLEFKETENLKLVVNAHLLEIARSSETIEIRDLIKYAKDHYKNSIFDKTHVYFSEEPKLPKGLNLPKGYHSLKCRIEGDNDEARTYYTVFSLNKDSDKGFDVEVVTSQEWDNLKKLSKPLTTIPQRASENPKDAETQRRYSELNEGVIDKFIREHIGTKESPGRFTEFKGRAEKLGWNEKYPDRAKPVLYYDDISKQFDGFLWTKIEQQLRRINSAFQFEIAFKNKNVVLIPLKENENLPVVEEKDPVTGEIRKVPVTSHTSANAVYFFIEQKFLNKIMVENHPWIDEEILSFFRKHIVHEMGESFGLPIVKITESGDVLNDLDIVYEAILDGSCYTNEDKTFKDKVENLKKLTENDIVNLDHLRWKSHLTGEDVERDYAAGKFEEIDPKTSQILKDFKDIDDLKTLQTVFSYVINAERFYEFGSNHAAEKDRFERAFGWGVYISTVRAALKTEYGKKLVKFKRAELDAWEKQKEQKKTSQILKDFKDIDDLKTLQTVFSYVIIPERFYAFGSNQAAEKNRCERAFGWNTEIADVRAALKTEYGKKLVKLKRAELQKIENTEKQDSESVFGQIYLTFREIDDMQFVEKALGVLDIDEGVVFSEENKAILRKVFGTENLTKIYDALEINEGQLLLGAYRYKSAQHNAIVSRRKLQEICEKFRGVYDIELIKRVISIIDSENSEDVEENDDVLQNVFGITNLSDIRATLETKEGKLLLEAYRFESKQRAALMREKDLNEIREKFRDIDDLELLEEAIDTLDSQLENISEEESIRMFSKSFPLQKIRTALYSPMGIKLLEAKRMELEEWVRPELLQNQQKTNVKRLIGYVADNFIQKGMAGIPEDDAQPKEKEAFADAIWQINQNLHQYEKIIMYLMVNEKEDNPKLSIRESHKKELERIIEESYPSQFSAGVTKNLIEEAIIIYELNKDTIRDKVFELRKKYENSSMPAVDVSDINGRLELVNIIFERAYGVNFSDFVLYDPIDNQSHKVLKRELERRHDKKIKTYTKMANVVGVKIAPPANRYTLFTFCDMYRGKEFQEDRDAFASRFRLLKIGTGKKTGLSMSILGRMTELRLDPKNVIVQLPSSMADSGVLNKIKEKAPGIKFIIVDTQGLKETKEKRARDEYRKNIYSMMYLARNINRGARKNSKLYRLLRNFVKWHFPIMDDRDAEIDKYMQSLMNNNISGIVNCILSYMPIQKVAEPDAALVSATFMSA